MRLSPRSLVPALLIGSAFACSDGTAPPKASATSSSPAVSKPMPIPVRLLVLPDAGTMALGSEFSFAAYKVLSDSSRLPVSAFWSSSDDQVLTVNPINGYAMAVGSGHAMVTARVDALVAVATMDVAAPPSGGASDAIVVDSFSMIEFQYPASPANWSYAPQMRAHAEPGHSVSVQVLRFAIPGLGNIPAFSCGARLNVTPLDLFGEVYGDWLLEIVGGAQRATGDQATVTMTFLDNGKMATRVVSGPIVPGSFPATYTGGANGGACYHGYGSTG